MRFHQAPRDPSRTGRIESQYDSVIERLITRFERQIIALLKERGTEQMDIETFGRLDNKIVSLIKQTILDPGKVAVDSHIDKTFKVGLGRAAQFLKSAGLRIDVVGAMGVFPADRKVIEVLRDRNYDALKGMTDEMAKKLKDTLTDSVIYNKSIHATAKEISESLNIGRSRAETIARTETMYAFNVASKTQYDRYGVEEVEWLTAYDERVCDECGPLNGKKFKRDEAPDCPLHPNCRCVLLPVIEEVS